MVQAFFRGWKARKDVKRVFQFECRTMNRNMKAFTQSDTEIQQARDLVMQIRKDLETFNYDPAPADYN